MTETVAVLCSVFTAETSPRPQLELAHNDTSRKKKKKTQHVMILITTVQFMLTRNKNKPQEYECCLTRGICLHSWARKRKKKIKLKQMILCLCLCMFEGGVRGGQPKNNCDIKIAHMFKNGFNPPSPELCLCFSRTLAWWQMSHTLTVYLGICKFTWWH